MIHIKQLDTIRTFAVMLVIVTHWYPFYYFNLLDLGTFGVNLFFVLSGFLITQILLENRKEAETKGYGKINIVKNFVIRRSLRIFPIYYLAIFALYILGPKTGTSIREDFPSYLFYASNFLFYMRHAWDGVLSHLWTLAVEEQFYLMWPWIMIFINRKYLLSTIIMFFFIGVFSNYVIPGKDYFVTILTPTCFDSFSLGGLLAYSIVYKKEYLNSFAKYLPYAAAICFFAYIISAFYSLNIFIPARTLVSITSLYLIFFAIYKKGSIIHKYVLNNKILIFTGKISYGIYLYHNILPYFWNRMINRLTAINIRIPLINAYIPANWSRQIIFIEQLFLLIFIAWLSWKLIEFPINNLKNKFSYKQVSPASPVQSSLILPSANNYQMSDKS